MCQSYFPDITGDVRNRINRTLRTVKRIVDAFDVILWCVYTFDVTSFIKIKWLEAKSVKSLSILNTLVYIRYINGKSTINYIVDNYTVVLGSVYFYSICLASNKPYSIFNDSAQRSKSTRDNIMFVVCTFARLNRRINSRSEHLARQNRNRCGLHNYN